MATSKKLEIIYHNGQPDGIRSIHRHLSTMTTYVLHRSEANKNMMPTYQRLIKKKRLQEVRSFINDGGYFPNSIIICITPQASSTNEPKKFTM